MQSKKAVSPIVQLFRQGKPIDDAIKRAVTIAKARRASVGRPRGGFPKTGKAVGAH